MGADAKVDFNTEAILASVGNIERKGLTKIALVAKEYAQANAPRDTGFHAESITVVGDEQHGAPWSSGSYFSPKTGRNVARVGVPLVQPPDENGAIMHAPAAHAIFAELHQPHLYKAAELAASEADGIISTVAKSEFGS